MAKRTTAAAVAATLTSSGNRVQRAIGAMQNRLDAMNGVTMNGMPLSELEAKQNLEHAEWFAYQEKQAEAHASGRLTADEARTVYNLLGGENYSGKRGGWSAGAGLAEKLTVVRLMGELVGLLK
jgi:hypothetical protein